MPGIFGGNGSVEWTVEVNRGKGAPKCKDNGGGKHHHEGIDDTDPNKRFEITIQHPLDAIERLAFRQQLYDAWNAFNTPNPPASTTLSIPIEDKGSDYNPPTKNQIKVDWPK
jgi:hypothetical protein